MITLTKRTPWRQTSARVQDRGKAREVLAALEPAALVIRLKGTRTELRLPWPALHLLACRAQADAAIAARRAKRGGSNGNGRRVRRGVLACR